ncbi:uncharacterized protein LOC125296826 [Xyrichtys novacula]|nr:uncharacterized protein LOC125296826 [Xyrichtys novacula]
MENLKASEAYQYLHSGKVGCVLAYKHDGFVYLKANVEPSQCLNNSPHSAWVMLNENGDVQTAGCTCVAGPGRSCSHAAAIMWKVENAVRQGKTGLACTDRQNKWNAGSQRNAGQRKMKDVQFKRHCRQKIYQPSTTMQSSTTTSSTTTNSRQEARLFGTHEEWRKHVLASPMAGLFTCPGSSLLQLCLDGDPSPTTPQSPPLHNLSHDDHHTPLSCRKCRTFYDDYVNMPTAQLENIEKLTKAQSKVQLWHDMRRVRITASTARKVPIRSTTSPEKFLSEHLYPTFHGNAATRHGAVSEEHARQFLNTQGHTIENKGLVVCPAKPWLAASPDGVMNKEMLLEIKSPVLGKKSLREALATKNAEVTPLADGHYLLASNGPKGYYMQVQLGMHCTGLPRALLVIWNNTEHIEIQVPYDKHFLQTHITRLRTFYFTHMLPKIVDDFVKGRLQLCNTYLTLK